MVVTEPAADQVALWAAEQLWDWRVRMLFTGVCAVAALGALFVYMKWGRNRVPESTGKARTYFGRISVTMFVITLAEKAFFDEYVSTTLLFITSLVIGFIGLRTPRGDRSEQ